MAAVSAINVAVAQLMEAGTTVAGHLDVAAKPPVGAVPVSAAASPVDVAAGQAAAAMQTKMTAMHGALAPKGPELHATTAASAGALQAQDARNASPLKDLASAIPSGGGGGGGGSSPSSGQGKIQAFDNHFFKQGPDQPGDPAKHPWNQEHRPDGTWAPGNSGRDGHAAADHAFDKMQDNGATLVRKEITVKMTDPDTGKTITRKYDALLPTGEPGKYIGLEHKVNDNQLKPNQEYFDGIVNGGTPARGTLDGEPIEVIEARQINTPWPLEPATPAEPVAPKAPVAEPIPEAPALGPKSGSSGFGAGPGMNPAPHFVDPNPHHVPHVEGDWAPDPEEIP